MELIQLINSVSVIQVIGEVQRQDISGIFYDSRQVIKNSIFVAVKGYKTDGHKYILDAINNGAIAIILENNSSLPDEVFIHRKVAKILVKDSRFGLAQISSAFYGYPSKKLKVIGITGTNGKTTTSHFIKTILETAGRKTGLIGTISNWIGDKEIKSSLTTPESNDLNELLFNMYKENCSYAVMEVSSHSLVLGRTVGISFNAGVLTNITSDHLDFHENFENYLEAKKILFDSLSRTSFGILNADDKNSKRLMENSNARFYFYGRVSNADFIIKDIRYDFTGTKFILQYNNIDYPISTTFIGEFNAYNAVAAFSVCALQGIKENIIINGIKNTKRIPGRFEVIGNGNEKVIIDYSHTADSLEKALRAIHDIVKKDIPVYTVFGCGGNRDISKRAV
ncbi:MAG TPA: UDP-N-acetylmuramoyl-L-alanyl-D-glutamate--2,6-diaminopimelate ligase, partial [Ignavibacteria bacterium]|nr:UDP-N-acetylmuramoyl-L-alanyl-D-glutamate--2,6-diaminopimelate ligase [Ignavibacteria bacterium]